MSTGYDYTREEAADDYVLDDAGTVEKSVDEMTRNRLVPGVQVLRVMGLAGAPDKKEFPVWMKTGRTDANGQPDMEKKYYNSAVITVVLADPYDTNLTVEDMHRLPPADKEEQNYYWNGVPAHYQTGAPDRNAKGILKKPGFWSGKYIHFLESLGFHIVKGKAIPEEARRTANWKMNPDRSPKLVQVEVEDTTYVDKNTGQTKQGRPQVKLYSYAMATQDGSRPPVTVGVGTEPASVPPSGAGGSAGGAPAGRRAPAFPAAAVSAANMDDFEDI